MGVTVTLQPIRCRQSHDSQALAAAECGIDSGTPENFHIFMVVFGIHIVWGIGVAKRDRCPKCAQLPRVARVPIWDIDPGVLGDP